jgi:hypothetical protein
MITQVFQTLMVSKEGEMEGRSRGKRRNGSKYSHAPISVSVICGLPFPPKNNWKII